MAQEQASLQQEKKAAGFFSSLRSKKDTSLTVGGDDASGAKSPHRSPRARRETEGETKPKSGLIKKPPTPLPTGSTGVSTATKSGSLGKVSGKPVVAVFVPDSKETAEVNAIRKRAWEEEQRLNAAISAEFVWNTSLSEDENLKNQLRWEGEQKLQAAMTKLHRDKEAVARAHPKEDQAVKGYAARFTKRSQKRKVKNPNTVVEDAGGGGGAQEEGNSSGLKPGRQQTDAAMQYLKQYGAMTPQAALKKRLLMSEAEREINVKSKGDSYLNQFLEDKADVAPKKADTGTKRGVHIRRSSDSFSSSADLPIAKEAPALSKRSSVLFEGGGRKRSSSHANMTRSGTMPRPASSSFSESQAKLERKETQERLLEVEQQKVLQAAQPAKSAVLSRVSAALNTSQDSSDVEESSSTFESDSEEETRKKTAAVKANSPSKKSWGEKKKKQKKKKKKKKKKKIEGLRSKPRKKVSRSLKKATSSSVVSKSASLSLAGKSSNVVKVESVVVASPEKEVDASGLTKSRRVTDAELPTLLKLGVELGKV
jgi:hypothetical protein